MFWILCMLVIAVITYAWDGSESKKEAHRREQMLMQAYQMRQQQAQAMADEIARLQAENQRNRSC